MSASVTVAKPFKRLRNRELAERHEASGGINLTLKGQKAAKQLTAKFLTL